jgi:hypothetical protein
MSDTFKLYTERSCSLYWAGRIGIIFIYFEVRGRGRVVSVETHVTVCYR